MGDAYQVLLRYFAEQKTLRLPAFENHEEQLYDEYEAEKEEWYRQQFENGNKNQSSDEPYEGTWSDDRDRPTLTDLMVANAKLMVLLMGFNWVLHDMYSNNSSRFDSNIK